MIVAPTIELIPGGIRLSERTMVGEQSAEELRTALGKPTRVEVKNSGGRPWRSVEYFDDLGVYMLTDLETKRAVYVGFPLTLEGTSFPPRVPFVGKLYINGTQLIPGMKNRELPLRGDLNFVKGIGAAWKCVHDNGYVELNMKKPKGAHSAREPGLALVTHSFLKD